MAVLLERTEELSTLAAAATEAARGSGSTVVLEGPAGIGKTSVLLAAGERLGDAGLDVLRARGSEVERELPYAVMRRLLGRPLRALEAGERAERLSGPATLAGVALGLVVAEAAEAEPAAFAAAFAWLAADLAERAPLALVVDDLHWADAASVRALLAIGASAPDLPLLVVLSTRPDAERTLALDALLRDTRTRVLRPRVLTSEATAELAAGLLGDEPDASFVAECHRATGGVPLFVRECLGELRAAGRGPTAEAAEALREVAPEAIARMVLLRLARVDVAAQELARAVAVLGDGAEVRSAAALAGLAPHEGEAAADALAREQVLIAVRPLEYLHPVFRTAVYRDLPPGRRSELHARAAALLAADGAGADHVASHLLQTQPAGDPGRVDHLVAAARDALAAGAPDTAVAWLRRALAEPPPQADRWAVRHLLGVAALNAGDDDAIDDLRAGARAAPDGPVGAAAHYDLGRALAMSNHHAEAVAEIDRAVAAVRDADPGRALRYAAQALWMSWQADELGEDYWRRLAALPRGLSGAGVGEQLVLSYQAHEACTSLRPHTEALELARRALAGGRLYELGLEGGGPASFALSVLVACDRIEEAVEELEIAGAAMVRLGAVIAVPLLHLQLAHTVFKRGDLAAVEYHVGQARELLTDQPSQHFGHDWAAALESRLLVERGRAGEALAALPGGDVPLRSTFAVELLCSRAHAHLASGDPERTLQDLGIVERWTAQKRHTEAGDEILFSTDLALAHHRLGDVEAARRCAERLLGQAQRFGAAGMQGEALRVAALVGPDHARIGRLEQAVELLAPTGRRLSHARALVDLGASLRRVNRRVDARERLRDGIDLASRCGAAALVEHATEELRASGGRLRREHAWGVEGLTPSEHRIAALAARGRTNREIARELFVTVKTVEMHLGNVYRKLDVPSRSGLAGVLGEQGLPE